MNDTLLQYKSMKNNSPANFSQTIAYLLSVCLLAKRSISLYRLAFFLFSILYILSSTHSVSALTSINSSSAGDVRSGLVGWWTFDGKNLTNTSARDVSGNGRHGTLTNMTTPPKKAVGKVGQALQFDGVNDYVSVPYAGIDFERTDAFSISAWIKFNDVAGSQSIMGRTNGIGNQGTFFARSKNASGISNQNGIWVVLSAALSGGGSIFVKTATSTAMPNVWNHVVLTYDGSSDVSGLKIYINGVNQAYQVVSNNLTGSIKPVNNWRIGDDQTSDYAAGLIDEVRMYNRAITSAEVQSLYKAGGGVVLDTVNRIEFITTPGASTWTVPQGVYSVKVEAIGAGGGGGSFTGSGGGGGAYAVKRNITVTPGSVISVNIGTGGAPSTAGTDTTFNTSVVVAKGGSAGVDSSGSQTLGGQAASSTPTAGAFSGGRGGARDTSYNSGGAGGGAASYLGAGGDSGGVGAQKGGAGGGGGGGGSAGGNSATGGAPGGGNDLGVGGGTPPTGSGSNGGSGVGHSAGGGAGGFSSFNSSTLWPGGVGGNGAEWDITHGSGGGGGAGAANGGSSGGVGGNGGNYGGGGGGGGLAVSGGTGGNGLIVITYKVGKITAVSSPASNNRTGINSGLVGHWTFDGKNMTSTTALDISGNNRTGTLTNMTQASSKTIGKLGQGLRFDGTNDYVSIPYSGIDYERTQPITISTWIKLNNVAPAGGFQTIFGRLYDVGPAKGTFLGWCKNAVTDICNANSFTFYLASNGNVNGISVTTPTNSSLPNVWTHVVVTYAGNSNVSGVKIYKNGINQTLTTNFNNLVSSITGTTNWRIGDDGTTDYTSGIIDDVRFYNRELTAKEVQSLYKLGTQ